MITNPTRNIAVSTLGWIDHDALWIFDAAASKENSVSLHSGAKYLSLHYSGTDYFAVAHHFDGVSVEITVHSFSNPAEVLSRAAIWGQKSELSGDTSLWRAVPSLYVEYLSFEPWKDFVLLKICPVTERIEIQRLDWYDDTYDKGYQGVIGVLALPDADSALVSLQRCSDVVLHELSTGKKKGSISLAKRGGNPLLQVRNRGNEIWASDYDSLVVLDGKDLHVLRSIRLQNAPNGTQQFIGDYAFSSDGEVCVVARPFEGDFVGINPLTLRTISTVKTGKQPIEVVALPQGKVIGRDWKTGALLQGELRRRWFAF
jgi:hypothetical protein